MRTRSLCTGCIVVLLVATSVARAALIEGSDPRAEPFKEAVAALAKAIGAGSLEDARAVYAGEGVDLKLLEAYVDGVAAAKALRAAMDSTFGADPERADPTLDDAIARMGVKDLNTVILYDDDPEAAATSANNPLGVGIEFKRVNGEWKVRSLASKPDRPQRHIARLTAYTRSLAALTEKVPSGG